MNKHVTSITPEIILNIVSIHINLYQNRFINDCARKKAIIPE